MVMYMNINRRERRLFRHCLSEFCYGEELIAGGRHKINGGFILLCKKQLQHFLFIDGHDLIKK